MKVLQIIFVVLSVTAIALFFMAAGNFIFRLTADFPLAGISLLGILFTTVAWAVVITGVWIRRKKLSQKTSRIFVGLSAILSAMACTQWGAFGLGVAMVFILVYIFPRIKIIKPVVLPETALCSVWFFQTLFITGSYWFGKFAL